MSFTNYTENKVLRHVTTRAWSAPVINYLGLYTVAPTDAGGGSFVTEAGTEEIRFGTPVIGNPTYCANTNLITFGPASGNWGQITAWGLFDSSAGAANLLWWGEFDAPLETITIGEEFEVPVGGIVLELD